MIVERSNFYVVAGGPGSGKTALIEALRARGQLCVDECIRKILRQQVKISGDGLHWKDQTIFRELRSRSPKFCSRADAPELESGLRLDELAVHLKQRIHEEINGSAFRFRIDH